MKTITTANEIRSGDMVRTDWARGGSPDDKAWVGFVRRVSPGGAMLIVDWNTREGRTPPRSAISASMVERLAR